MGFAGLAGVLAVLIGQTAPDPFTTQHTAAAALNTLSPRFTISIAGSHRTFRVGERISLVLTYDDVANRRGADDGRCAHNILPVLNRTAGTGDPRRDIYRTHTLVPGGICGCAEGGIVGGPAAVIGEVEYDANGVPSLVFKPAPPPPPKPKPPPVKVSYELTEHVRFDVPGRYRLYLSDDVTYGGGPIISNIIEIEIAARDGFWEDETLRRVVRILDSASSVEQQSDASRTLQSLTSRKALDEMARRGMSWGLFGARDRAGAIAAVTRRVDDPSRAVSDGALQDLAGLHATRSAGGVVPGGVMHRALMQAHGRRLRALASAGVLVERLVETWSTANEDDGDRARSVSQVTITPALGGFTKQVESALSRLPAAEREATLTRHALTFTDDRRFLPMLRRLAQNGSPAADGLLADFTSIDLPAPPVRFFAPRSRQIYAEWDEEARRRTYRIGGTAVYFDALSQALAQFPAGTSFDWIDQLAHHRTLNREAEFHRIERVVRRAGMSLRSR